MSRRRRYLVVLATGILLIAVLSLFRRESQPEYNGQPLTEWLRRKYSISTAPDSRAEATNVVRAVGTNALPYLMKWLQYEQPWPTRKFLQLANGRLRWIPGITSLRDGQQQRVYLAQSALADFGPEADVLIPELVRLMNDPRRPQKAKQAAGALAGRKTAQAMPQILMVLTNQSHTARRIVIMSISRLGTNAYPAIPALLQCLQDADLWVAHAALSSLGALKLDPARVVPAVAASLQHTNASVRSQAAFALGEFAAEARAAVPSLQACLNDRDLGVRASVGIALQRIATEALTNATAK